MHNEWTWIISDFSFILDQNILTISLLFQSQSQCYEKKKKKNIYCEISNFHFKDFTEIILWRNIEFDPFFRKKFRLNIEFWMYWCSHKFPYSLYENWEGLYIFLNFIDFTKVSYSLTLCNEVWSKDIGQQDNKVWLLKKNNHNRQRQV